MATYCTHTYTCTLYMYMYMYMYTVHSACACTCTRSNCSNPPTEDRKAIRQEAESIAKTMNLSVVRLCFQVRGGGGRGEEGEEGGMRRDVGDGFGSNLAMYMHTCTYIHVHIYMYMYVHVNLLFVM